MRTATIFTLNLALSHIMGTCAVLSVCVCNYYFTIFQVLELNVNALKRYLFLILSKLIVLRRVNMNYSDSSRSIKPISAAGVINNLEHGSRVNLTLSNFISLRILAESFYQILYVPMFVLLTSGISEFISYAVIVLLPSDQPYALIVLLVFSDIIFGIMLHYILTLTTSVYLLSEKIIRFNIDREYHVSKHNTMFWKSMRPLKQNFGPFTYFDSMYFVLFLWGEVIMKTTIDLLISI